MLPLRRPHADPLVSDPRPIFHRGGLINSPNASVDTLAARDRVRFNGNFPLTSLVGEAVADLEMLREDVIGEKSGLLRRERPCRRRTDPRLLFHADPQSKPVASAGCR